jgi:hypothetical protein
MGLVVGDTRSCATKCSFSGIGSKCELLGAAIKQWRRAIQAIDVWRCRLEWLGSFRPLPICWPSTDASPGAVLQLYR